MAKKTRKKRDGRFSDPMVGLREDKDGNRLNGTDEEWEMWERQRKGLDALARGDEETYRRLCFGHLKITDEET
ncbi:MAG: hypothetical protein OXC80_03835 [Gammaproteobacteria bacterium]|nr:hypothetical protein [Gammaproteobacteria bacterium]